MFIILKNSITERIINLNNVLMIKKYEDTYIKIIGISNFNLYIEYEKKSLRDKDYDSLTKFINSKEI